MSDQSTLTNKPRVLKDAEEICGYLNSRGVKINVNGLYYGVRVRKWRIGRSGKDLMTTDHELDSQLEEITSV